MYAYVHVCAQTLAKQASDKPTIHSQMAPVEATGKATNLQLQCLYLSNIMHKILDETSKAAICNMCQFGRLALLGNTIRGCCRCEQPIADFSDHTATKSGSPVAYMMTSSW